MSGRYIVTGAASGIGDAVARGLAAAGHRVVSLDLVDPSAPVESHIRTDMGDPSSVEDAIGALEGGWDGLVNVAGIPGTHPPTSVFRVNFLGLRKLTEAILSRLVAGGSVVSVSSTAGFRWPARVPELTALMRTETFEEGEKWLLDQGDGQSAYALSKEAVTFYTLHRALSLGRQGRRINAVLPGPVQTPILPDFEASMGKELLDSVKALFGRHATPEEVAAAVLFLVSTAAGWVNGQQLAVDNGITAAWSSGAVPPPGYSSGVS